MLMVLAVNKGLMYDISLYNLFTHFYFSHFLERDLIFIR